jgi:hypothetical protein
MTLTQKHLTYDIKSHKNDEIVTHEYGNGEYDTEEDGYPVIHMVSGINESGDSVYYESRGLYAPAKTWKGARKLVGADVGEDDSPAHGWLHAGWMDRVDYWVVETTEEA